MSAHQLWRMLGFGSYRTAWFMAHRIREGMRTANSDGPLGGEGKTVEIDEAYIGGLEKNRHRNKRKHAGPGGLGKEAVFALVERGGSVRSFHVPKVNAKTLRPILVSQVDRGSFLMSDGSVAAEELIIAGKPATHRYSRKEWRALLMLIAWEATREHDE